MQSKHNDQDLSIFVVFFEKIAQKKLKSHYFNFFFSLQRFACWCHVGLKVYGNIYWTICRDFKSNVKEFIERRFIC